jgi:hypothetical protein
MIIVGERLNSPRAPIQQAVEARQDPACKGYLAVYRQGRLGLDAAPAERRPA